MAVPSERVTLARLARSAALGVPGVVAADAGPNGRFVTHDGDERLEGVTAVADLGGYEVSLRLVCGLVPLVELGESVRAAVVAAAAAAGLPLTGVDVHVAAVAEPPGLAVAPVTAQSAARCSSCARLRAWSVSR